MYTVMLVEDELNILRHMNKIISVMEEFEVKGAFSSPEEALEAFYQLAPNVVFLDIEMPRMNGIELAKRLRTQKDDVKIIFTTAYGNYALDAFEVEAIDYLMKPIMNEDIRRVLKRLNKAAQPSGSQSFLSREEPSFPVRCFGGFDVKDGQQQLIKWPTRKAEELFAYFVAHQGKYMSKWELLEVFWPDMEGERGLHNLYNTIYRIKQVLRSIPLSPQIQKINEGYILKAQGNLSDLGRFEMLMNQNEKAGLPVEDCLNLFFSYTVPLFGDRDYPWSIPIEKYLSQEYEKLCHKLLLYYYEQNQFSKGEEVIQYYAVQHIENEDMLREWLRLVMHWKDHENKAEEYRHRFNEKLAAAELPLL